MPCAHFPNLKIAIAQSDISKQAAAAPKSERVPPVSK
jgi:hypothetical protein